MHNKQRMLRHNRLGLLLTEQRLAALKAANLIYSLMQKINRMTTGTLTSPALQVDANENKINYLWLNGERVIGIEGLEIFEDCKQLHHLPAIKDEQRDELNSIINSTLERYAEEGICNYWPCLVTRAKEYFSKQGYCVIKRDKVRIELRQSIEVASASFSTELSTGKGPERLLTVADLWHIQRLGKIRSQRRFI